MIALPLHHEEMLQPGITEAKWGAIHVASATELLSFVPSAVVGLVVLDLPDHLVRGCHHFGGSRQASQADELLTELTPLAVECARVLHAGGSTVLIGSALSYAAWEIAAEWAGLVPSTGLTVLWDREEPARGKRRAGEPNLRPVGLGTMATPVRQHIKSGLRLPPTTRMILPSNVLICREVPVDLRYTPTQRPIELFSYIINTMTEPGACVLDPFCGSGSALVAAAGLSRPWMGGDIDQRACEIAMKRMHRAEVGHEFIYTQPMYWWVAGDTRILVEG